MIPDLNFSQEHVANMVAIMEAEKIGLGVLTYYPTLSGKVPLAPEIQGHDLKGAGYEGAGRPSYRYLYLRVRDDLKANYVVIQKKSQILVRRLGLWHSKPVELYSDKPRHCERCDRCGWTECSPTNLILSFDRCT